MRIKVSLNSDIPSVTVTETSLDLELADTATVAHLIAAVDQRNEGFKDAVLGSAGRVSNQVVFFVNGDNIDRLDGIHTRLNPGDVVNVIPAIAGG